MSDLRVWRLFAGYLVGAAILVALALAVGAGLAFLIIEHGPFAYSAAAFVLVLAFMSYFLWNEAKERVAKMEPKKTFAQEVYQQLKEERLVNKEYLIDNSEPRMNSPEYAEQVITARITADRIYISRYMQDKVLQVAMGALEDIAAGRGIVPPAVKSRDALEEIHRLIVERKEGGEE